MTRLPTISAVRNWLRPAAKPSGLRIIVPTRTELERDVAYKYPDLPNSFRCGTVEPTKEWLGDKWEPTWSSLPTIWTDRAQLEAARDFAIAAPPGCRAVLVSGFHGTGREMPGWPPDASPEWFAGWQYALYSLSFRMSSMGFPADTLIVTQSEHWPESDKYTGGHYPAHRWMGSEACGFPWANYFVTRAVVPPLSTGAVVPWVPVSMPGTYWVKGELLDEAMLRRYIDAIRKQSGPDHPIIPFVSEPHAGESAKWLSFLAYLESVGVTTIMLWAHNEDVPGRKRRIEAAWPGRVVN